MEGFPAYVLAYFDEDGDEIGDRFFAADAQRVVSYREVLPQLAPKKAVGVHVYKLTHVASHKINR